MDQFLDENREGLEKTLARLIALPSVREEPQPGKPYGENCRLVLEEAESIAREMGFRVRNFDNYCLEAELPGHAPEGAVTISFFGHLDVVPAGEGWNHPPFEATRSGEYIIGRGAVDDKGPAAALLYALKYLGDAGSLRNSRVKVVLGCNEEDGMDDMEYYLARVEPPEIALVADDDFPVCHGEKGSLRLELSLPLESGLIRRFEGGSSPTSVPGAARLELRGEFGGIADRGGPEDVTVCPAGDGILLEAAGISAHSSAPHTGRNALALLTAFAKERGLFPSADRRVLEVLHALLSDDRGRNAGIDCADDFSGALTCCGTMLRMEESHIVLSLDIRYPVTDRAERITGILADLIRPAGGTLRIVSSSPPALVEPDSPLVRKLTDLYNGMTGSCTVPYTMAGGTYARKIPGAFGFGAGNPEEIKPFGDGYGAAHGPDEAVSLVTLEQAVRVYAEALMMLDREARTGR